MKIHRVFFWWWYNDFVIWLHWSLMKSLSVWRLRRPMSNHLLRLYSMIFVNLFSAGTWYLVASLPLGFANGLRIIALKLWSSAYMMLNGTYILLGYGLFLYNCASKFRDCISTYYVGVGWMFPQVRTVCLTLRFLSFPVSFVYKSCVGTCSYIHCLDISFCLLLKNIMFAGQYSLS